MTLYGGRISCWKVKACDQKNYLTNVVELEITISLE